MLLLFAQSVQELDTVELWGALGERSTWQPIPTSVLKRLLLALAGVLLWCTAWQLELIVVHYVFMWSVACGVHAVDCCVSGCLLVIRLSRIQAQLSSCSACYLCNSSSMWCGPLTKEAFQMSLTWVQGSRCTRSHPRNQGVPRGTWHGSSQQQSQRSQSSQPAGHYQ